jgi:hypothetical protein
MNIRIDSHTLKRAEERGASADEIRDVIESGSPGAARRDRLAKSRVYAFNRERHGVLYEQKRVEVIYTRDNDMFVTVTVYVFYGKWEARE